MKTRTVVASTLRLAAGLCLLSGAAWSCATPSYFNFLFESSGSNSSVSVSAATSCFWTATSNSPWVTITSGGSGSGSRTLSFNVAANPTSAARQATITLTPASGTVVNLQVYQRGAGCMVSYGVSSSTVPAAAGTVSLQVYSTPSNCYVMFAPTPGTWLTPVSAGPFIGSNTIVYNVAVNQWNTPRRYEIVSGIPETAVTQLPGTACSAVALNPMALVQGSITGSSCAAQWRAQPRYSRQYYFSGTAGQSIAIEVTSATGVDTYVFLISPNGRMLAYNDDYFYYSVQRNSRIPSSGGFYTLPETGTYVIEVTTFFESALGDFSIQLVPGCAATLSPLAAAVPVAGGSGTFQVSAPSGCQYTALSYAPSWVTINSVSGGVVSYTAARNTGANQRLGEISVAGQRFAVSQGGSSQTAVFTPPSASVGSGASTQQVTLGFNPSGTSGWAVPSQPWVTPNPWSLYATTAISYSVQANPGTSPRTATLISGSQTFEITQAGASSAASGFVAVPPCRVVDTRPFQGTAGALGPPAMPGGTSRSFPIPSGSCGLPINATAYSFNITVVPQGPLSYLTIWPTGQPQPFVSTLNAPDGQVTANAAIVPAGQNGAVSVFVTNNTDVVIDVNGYFAAPGGNPLYTLQPCRVVDTRPGQATTGAFGPPSMGGGGTRSFPFPQSPCAIPANANAYSLNSTVVPQGPLGYLTVWPAGQAQPFVSTLNAFDGQVTANAAIVPAGSGGGVNAFVTNNTDLILDINGYFGGVGNGPALSFYPVAPCRVADTRNLFGPFGGPILGGGATRDFAVPQSACGIPGAARAYSMNFTVVPAGGLGYLTVWPTGQPQPYVSTLNSFDGQIVANAAIVPAGANGSISLFASNPTHVVIDINGYFAP